MLLSKEMAENPRDSEVSVVRLFFKKMSLQKKLDPKYHNGTFILDRLRTAVDVSAIHISLRDHLLRSSHQSVNRIANKLSDKVSSAGSSVMCMEDEEGELHETLFNYSLGKRFAGGKGGR